MCHMDDIPYHKTLILLRDNILHIHHPVTFFINLALYLDYFREYWRYRSLLLLLYSTWWKVVGLFSTYGDHWSGLYKPLCHVLNPSLTCRMFPFWNTFSHLFQVWPPLEIDKVLSHYSGSQLNMLDRKKMQKFNAISRCPCQH